MVVKLHFLDGLHTQHTSVSWMKHFSLAWVKQFQFFFFFHFKSHVYFAYLELVWDIHCWIHETLMYISCVFIWLLRGRNMVCFLVFCWFFFSHILMGSFCYLWSCFIFMHFYICDHVLCLGVSSSTYVLMSFIECFKKHNTFCQFLTKRGSKNWRYDGWLVQLILSPNYQMGSL